MTSRQALFTFLLFYPFTFLLFYLSKYFSTSACIFWNSGENW
ncbi:unknown [Segatella copri CAG:164]|nr:unknown [Segatella copri CAG:164]